MTENRTIAETLIASEDFRRGVRGLRLAIIHAAYDAEVLAYIAVNSDHEEAALEHRLSRPI
jgi:hypothetical protein